MRNNYRAPSKLNMVLVAMLLLQVIIIYMISNNEPTIPTPLYIAIEGTYTLAPEHSAIKDEYSTYATFINDKFIIYKSDSKTVYDFGDYSRIDNGVYLIEGQNSTQTITIIDDVFYMYGIFEKKVTTLYLRYKVPTIINLNEEYSDYID